MSVAPPALPICSRCQATLDPNGSCPSCRAPEDWADQIEAIDFVLRRLGDWQQEGQASDPRLQKLTALYAQKRTDLQSALSAHGPFVREPTFPARDECWSCAQYLYKKSSHCTECGAPIEYPAVKSLRYWQFLQAELKRHEESGLLPLRQAHTLIGETQERIDALRRKLERDRAVMVIPVDDSAPPPPRRRKRAYEDEPTEPAAPTRTFMEVLLDPQTTQWLLLAGGALIVLGLIIWLTSLGLFDNPGFIAIALGAGNAALLGAGYALILRTRFQNAGRALTLLACMLMPLNLWFYHTHKLLTLENYLWVAALVCCIIYTASAFVLKDPLFVYVLVGGVTLTGLLILAQVNHFGEVLAPTILLIALGLICLHAERAFPPEEGPFSRERFGMAFFWSSQALFAVGLLLLLGAQFTGWLFEPIFRLMMARAPDVAAREMLPWTLAIVLAGTYAYIYSDLVVRKIGVYLYLAAITVLWAEIHVLVLAGFADETAIVIITLALTALVINIAQTQLQAQQPFFQRAFPIGLLLSLVPVVFGILLHFRAVNVVMNEVWRLENGQPFTITWPNVIAMAVTALCCRVGAFLYRRSFKEIAFAYYFATAAATLVFAAGLAWMIGLKPWETEAPVLMLIPILYLIASYFYRGHTAEEPMIWCGHAATVVMLICTLWAAVMDQVVPPVAGPTRNFLFAAFCLEAALFYALAGVWRRSQVSLYLAAVMFCGAVWQMLISFDLRPEFYPVAFSLIGFLLLILYRVGVFEKLDLPSLDRGIFQSANALLTLGFAAGALLSLSRAVLTERELARLDQPGGAWRTPVQIMLYVLIFLTVISLLAAWLVQHPAWRRVHLVLTVINGVLIAVMIHKLSELSPWQKLEIFSIVVGVLLLMAGYIGWYRETERASDLVSIAFLFGSVALVMPLLIAAIVHKANHDHMPGWDDLGVIVACIALFGSGVMCRIKTTTLVGIGGMICFLFVILIDLVHQHEQWVVGFYLTIGGGLLFGTGVFLSIYRDRLLSLPDRIRRREGVFRIFDWR